jgi:hypothetical protein
VAEWRNAGVRPLGLSVRMRPGREDLGPAGHSQHGVGGGPMVEDSRVGAGRTGGLDSRYGSRHRRRVCIFHAAQPGAYRGGTNIGQVDPALMSLIRRLAHSEPISYPGGEDPYADYGMGGEVPVRRCPT